MKTGCAFWTAISVVGLLFLCQLPWLRPTPVVVRPDEIITFAAFTNPQWDYRISVPEKAELAHSDDWREVTFVYEGNLVLSHADNPQEAGKASYTIQVDVVPTDEQTPGDLLQTVIPDLVQPSGQTEIDNPQEGIRGLVIYHALEATERCAQPRALTAVFVQDGLGYLVHICTDGPGQCDVEQIPQTQPVLDSFRFPDRLSETPTASGLKPPDADAPAAGICADPPEGELVTIRIHPDTPDPRCARARADQKLQVVNDSSQRAQVRLAGFEATLEPGQDALFDQAVGQYLAPGVHWVSISTLGNATLWVMAP